jgi:outer membrane protein assembly factor BamA
MYIFKRLIFNKATPWLLIAPLLLVSTIEVHGESTPESNDSMIVTAVHIYGNRITKEKIIRMYLSIDDGDTIDSARIAYAKKRLQRTKLFSKVNLFTMKKNDGVHLYVVVTEHFYLVPDAGGTYYRYKYNKEQLWFRLNLSLSHRNFRGNGEEAKIAVAFWDSRSLSLSWTKPLLPSDFYISSSLAVDRSPALVNNYNTTQIGGKLLAGKEILDYSQIAFGFFPYLNKQQWIDTAYLIKTSELYTALGWVTDRRDRLFNPSAGFYFYADLRFNNLYHKGTRSYLQSISELRLYHPGIFEENIIALHLGTTIRNKDAGPIHYLTLGGVKSIRGYASPVVGNSIRGNNTFTFSCEYRFPIFRLPYISVPMLSSIDNRFESVDIRIHGALIGDFGRVGSTLKDLFSVKAQSVESGSGLGVGIRVLAPDFETNGCIDVVFPQAFWLPRGTLRYSTTPEVHLYLNFPY